MHLRAKIFAHIGLRSHAPSDLKDARAAAGNEMYKGKRAEAFANVYELSRDASDIAMARIVASAEFHPIDRAMAWARIGVSTKDPADFAYAEKSLKDKKSLTVDPHACREAQRTLSESYAKAGNFKAAYRMVSEIPTEAGNTETCLALLAIGRTYAADGRLIPAVRTVERIGSPYWRARGLLALHADITRT